MPLGLDVVPTQPAALPSPASTGSGAWSQPVAGKHYRALTPVGEQLQRDVQAEFAKLSEAERYDPATIDLYNIALLHIHANENGRVALETFHPEMLHGFTLPRFLLDQHYPASIIHSLAHAQRAGISQAQLDVFIRADMVRQGWLKS